MLPRKFLGLVLLLAAMACAQELPNAPSAQANVQRTVVVLHYMVQMQRAQGTTKFEAWAGPDSAKAMIRETDDRGFAPGVIIIARDNGELRQMGSVTRGEYFEFTRAEQEEAAKRRVAGFTFAPFQVKETLNQPGEKVLGLATTHRRFEMSSTFTQAGVRHTYHATQDIWFTHDVTLPNLKLELLFSQGATGIAAIDNLSFNDAGGFPVRRITGFEIDGQSVGKSEFELLAVERIRVPEKDLQMPAGMKQVQQPAR